MKIFMNICLLILVNLSFYSYAEVQNPSQLSIIIPNKIGPLEVGMSNYDDVIKLLGNTELMENAITKRTNQETLELKYPRIGIELTIDKNKQMRVVRIEVYRPFSGKSSEGLCIGMPITTATQLITSKYGKPKVDLKGFGYVDWEIPNAFALKHENGVVISIKMLGMAK